MSFQFAMGEVFLQATLTLSGGDESSHRVWLLVGLVHVGSFTSPAFASETTRHATKHWLSGNMLCMLGLKTKASGQSLSSVPEQRCASPNRQSSWSSPVLRVDGLDEEVDANIPGGRQ